MNLLDLTQRELIKKHLSTHTACSAEDQDAVNTLNYFLRSEGRINTSFSSVDKWPNHDGTFEFVSNPDIERYPKQSFSVQIKGTHHPIEKDGVISYSLKSLAYPAYIASEVTADPGILFLVINPGRRGAERVFWKYLSSTFISNIDFSKESCTIKFEKNDEIKNTDESIDEFCEKLDIISDTHLYLRKLNCESLEKEDAFAIVDERCKEIAEDIEVLRANSECRDKISKRILTQLYDLCYAVIILNAYKMEYACVSERLAWEVAQFSPETRYLCNFLKGLKYINHRIPKDGQAERLMLKYYNYLWEIRNFFKRDYNIDVLDNLESFPLNLDKVDSEYYVMVAKQIEDIDLTPRNVRVSRYYIQRITPFFVNGERYYEITLQLAGLYTTKFNRVTVYSKKTILTNYSIQIAYSETEIELWGIKNRIKVLNDWKVAIDPSCLNKFAKMLHMGKKINRNYGEYIGLMKVLTETGMNLLDIVNLSKQRFAELYNRIYGSANTHDFGDVLQVVRNNYSKTSDKPGRNTVCYALLYMREEVLEEILPNQYNKQWRFKELFIGRKCYPFEKNPLISNLSGSKTSQNDREGIIEIIDNPDTVALVQPYIIIENLIRETGELLFEKGKILSEESIINFNKSLDIWEKNQGYCIVEKNDLLCIDSYYNTTINILKRLLEVSQDIHREQKKNNEDYLNNCGFKWDDSTKEAALRNLFVNSNLMLIYGAAGTGKTTLVKHISNIMRCSTKLYLTKTHTALQNMQRHLEYIDDKCKFSIIDSITRSNSMVDYDIVFVDECSTIDNRTMKALLDRINKGTMLVLSGDIYQIESIDFGNWFYYAKEIIKVKGANIELNHTWRTEKEELKSLWKAVREKSPIITEKLAMDGPFSDDLGEKIFCLEDEEVVLCLNYDGKFGLNNMNQYFQNANTQSAAYSWEEWKYKIGDRIIFTSTKRSALLYNNLKGVIVNIEYGEKKIVFTIEVKTHLLEAQCENASFEFIKNTDDGTIIKMEILSWDDELSEDDKVKTVIPFQLGYAISIHKAQGLEYKSVKVVIPSSNAEKITHSVFYTAITRAKEKLKIYWSAETMKTIIESFSNDDVEHRTLAVIKHELFCENEI